MNNKGQIGMSVLLIAFVGIICSLVLYQAISEPIGVSSGVSLVTVKNQTVSMPAAGGSIDLSGQELVGTPLVTNQSGTVVSNTNYTIDERVDSTGVKGVVLTTKTGAAFASKSVNISYQYYPDGYADDGGSRGMILIIPIVAALAIAVVALVPALRNGLVEMIGR